MSTSKQSLSPARKRGPRRGSSAPTIADVAAEARFSPMTVSRVMNGEGNVREETRQAVLEAIEKLRYSPNRAARSLAGAEQARIALMFDNPSASYLSEFLMGALEEAGRRDIQLVVQRCDEGEGAKEWVRHLIEGGIRGFILPPPLCDDQGVLDYITQMDGLAIAVGPGQAAEMQGSVLIDDYQAAFEMTDHIIALGHKHIGFIIGNPEQVASERRLAGFLAAMDNAGIEVLDHLVAQGRFTYRSGLEAAEKLLSSSPRPTAIFASNDDMAAATVSVAHRKHLNVPEDISVCGFDDTDMASSIWPELTTIQQPIREMAGWAIVALARLMKAKSSGKRMKPESNTLPYKLIKRESDGPPPPAFTARKK